LVKVNRGEASLTARYPWIVAFVFGLLHGFGFAGALGEVGLPSNEVPLALLMFNVGVEVGQSWCCCWRCAGCAATGRPGCNRYRPMASAASPLSG
jgi:hypothetical protein